MSVEEITLKASRITDESLESTRRMTQMLEESLNVGNQTTTMLDEQGEQLRNIKRELDHTNQDIKQAQKNLNELARSCCLWPFYRLRSTKRDRSHKQVRLPKECKQKKVSIRSTAVHKQQADSGSSATPSGPFISRVTHDKREDEMEENLQQTVSLIGTLKELGLEINNKLDDQIKDIEDINNEVKKAENNVASANKQARNLC